MVYDLAPGNVLQNMYLKTRLKAFATPGMRFVELGAGNGRISRILLERGLKGIGYDLNQKACEINLRRNSDFVSKGVYQVLNADFLTCHHCAVDIVISSHVIEHLPDDELENYFAKCKEILEPGGRIVSLVPSSMKYWGIEDETTGHYRRFEFQDFNQIAQRHELELVEMSGLTYPLSNFFFGLSNYLITKSELWKKSLSKEEQTKISATGVKGVKFKSVYPWYFKFIVNDVTMYPFYLLQRLFRKNSNSMVIYSEIKK